jgi:hypothetical protein
MIDTIQMSAIAKRAEDEQAMAKVPTFARLTLPRLHNSGSSSHQKGRTLREHQFLSMDGFKRSHATDVIEDVRSVVIDIKCSAGSMNFRKVSFCIRREM